MTAYTSQQRRTNQRNIVVGSALTIAAISLTALIRSTGFGPALAGVVLVVVVSVVLWRQFAVSTALPLPTDRKYARMWWVSEKWLERFARKPK